MFQRSIDPLAVIIKETVLSLVHNSITPLSAVFVWRFKFTNGQLDRETFEVDKWASLELPTRQ